MPNANDRELPGHMAWVESFLLREAHQLAERAKERLWRLKSWLAPKAGITEPERRQAPRFSESCRQVKVLTSPMHAEGVLCSVLDISPTGVALRMATPMEPGTALTLQPTEGFPIATQVAARVRYCRPEGDEWLIGCEFT